MKLLDLKKANKNVFQLSSSQEQNVRNIATSSTTTSYYAKAILGMVFNEFYVERPVLIESSLGKRGSELTTVSETKNSTSNNNLLNLYPNPATNFATCDYLFVKPYKSAKIVVTSITGAIIKAIELKQMSGQYEIDLQSLNAGVYFIELRADDNLISVKKLVVNK